MTLSAQPPHSRNHLLLRLTQNDFGLLKPYLEHIDLPVRLKLEVPNKPVKHVYFPESGIVSVVAVSRDHHEIEAAIIGSEGMTGLSVVLGDDRSPYSTYIQSAGSGQRIGADRVREAMQESGSLRLLFLRFAQAFLVQTVQTALANGRAKVGERLARWILMCHDRTQGRDLSFTHEFLALMLGVRRAGVTLALRELAVRGSISTRRGFITVNDRAVLEKMANGYYGIPEAEYARLIGWRVSQSSKKR